MTEYNALYGSPQAPQDNALYYDDTQGMPRQRPADPLRWLANAIGQNKDIPAPQFFMDPRALSARNMLHSALNTSANWLDGTKDPSLIGPEEMVSPLGAIGMGAALKPAASATPSLAKQALRQHMRAQESVYGPLTGPKHLAHLAESAATAGMGAYAAHGLMGVSPTAAATLGGAAAMVPHAIHIRDVYKRLKEIEARDPTSRRESVTLLADNAKGSAPGTVANSLAEQPHGMTLYRGVQAGRDPASRDGTVGQARFLTPDRSVAETYAGKQGTVSEEAVNFQNLLTAPNWMAAKAQLGLPRSASMDELIRAARAAGHDGMTFKTTNGQEYIALADNAKGSAPGTVVNSLAEQPQTIRAFHGTNARFDKFDTNKTNEAGFHFGTEPQANARRESHGADGWFSRWRNIPVDIEASKILDLKGDPGWFGGTALARHLHKEGVMPEKVVSTVRQMEAKDLNGANKYIRDWLKEKGYDLVRYPNRVEGGGDYSYMALGTGNVRNADTGKVMFADNAKGSAPGTVLNSLDMSEAARKARAKEQGFDTGSTWYHGTDKDFDRFSLDAVRATGEPDVAIALSSSPKIASSYAKGFGNGDGSRVIPTHTRLENPMHISQRDWGSRGENADLIAKAKSEGHDGIVLEYTGYNPPLREALVFDPRHIRSTQAAFDPAKRDSANLLAASPSASAPGLAANSTQQDDQGVMSILRRYGLADDSTDMMRLGGPGSFKVGEPSPVQKTVFAGTNSATADHAALAEAKELKAINERPEEIFRTTGWFQRQDGVWRNEIDDSQSRLKELVDKPGERKLGDVLDHPDLFAAYPQLKDISLVFSGMKDTMSGKAITSPMADFRSMQPWTRWGKKTHLVRINLNSIQNKDPKTARDIILHEVQHAIQDIEGDLTQEVMHGNAFVPYRDRLYEREGFEAQGRADMSKSERRNKTPGIADILKKHGLAD